MKRKEVKELVKRYFEEGFPWIAVNCDGVAITFTTQSRVAFLAFGLLILSKFDDVLQITFVRYEDIDSVVA